MKQPPRSVVNGTALLLIAIGLYLFTVILIKGCSSSDSNETMIPQSRHTAAVDSVLILDCEKSDSLKQKKETGTKGKRTSKVNSKKQNRKPEPDNFYSPLDNRHN